MADKLQRFVGPINPASLPQFTMSFCGFGLLFMAWFILYEVTATKYSRNIVKEMTIATIAAVLLGWGTLFLLLWVGIYV